MAQDIFDLTIIGGGPVGLFAAYYAGLRQMKVKVVESLNELGGQLQLLYPEKVIKDLPGFPQVKAQDFIAQLKAQVAQVDVTYCFNEEVDACEKKADLFYIHTNQSTHLSRTILVTTGGGAFVPRKLALPASETLEQQSLFYHVTDVENFKDQVVGVLGGGDSAVDWALTLEPVAKKVYLIHRRDNFRALEHSMSQLTASSVERLTPYVVEDLVLAENNLSGLQLRHVKTKEQQTLPVDKLLVSYGFINTHAPLVCEILGLEGNNIPVNSRCESSVPGLYAAGDVACYPGKINLIATGLGEAPTAVSNAYFYLHPESRLQPTHSTSM